VDNTYSSIEEKIVNVLAAKASQEELAEVRQWLSENDDHRRLYDEYATVWNASGAICRKDDYQPDAAWTALNKRMKPQKHNTQRYPVLRKKVLMMAAMMAAVFVAGMSVHRFSGNTVEKNIRLMYTEYTSPYGSRSNVRLPDGSTVWLNAGSSLRYSSDFNVRHREVFLEGEGYFDVTRNEQMSFLVKTSTITVKALGTAFNVKAYPEESFVETTVERGAVQLIDPLSSSQETTILRAQQKAVIVKEKQPEKTTVETPLHESMPDETIVPIDFVPIASVEVNSNVMTKAYTSWKDTRWVIEREKLSNFAVKLERRFNVQFVFNDEELKDYVFSGKFEDETLDQILEALKLTAPILYRVKQNTVYLSFNKMFIHPHNM